jgi:hypothetical protein
MSDATPYNPLDKKNLGASVAEALLGRKLRPLGELSAFHGAGIYAIYYRGDASVYERLARSNQGDDPQAPIYVGKAIPEGARKGGERPETADQIEREVRSHLELTLPPAHAHFYAEQRRGTYRVDEG